MTLSNIRNEFPILEHIQNGKKLVYLDNTATTQKPLCVIDAIHHFYQYENATVHRGIYGLSQQATDKCEAVRKQTQAFINAPSEHEIIFVKGTTEAINLVAKTYVKSQLKKGDELLITHMEHHANIVPWQQVCEEYGFILKVAAITPSGDLDLNDFKSKLSNRTKFVAATHVSNAIGTINPIKELAELAHEVGAKILIDGAQSIAHTTIDVQHIDADFFCFSSHKMYGPTGIGILYGKKDLLDIMPPYESGGDMIDQVTFEKTTYAKTPAKFEPGTPAIAQIIGFGKCLTFLNRVGLDVIQKHEHHLLKLATEKLSTLEGLTIIGTSKNKAAIISFTLEGIHPHDAGTILDTQGIAVRVGHHCAQPLMNYFKIPATIRASFSVYNTEEEVMALVKGIQKVKEIML